MVSNYLDLETGEVIVIGDEERHILETINDSYYDEQTQIVDWGRAFEKERVPKW